MSSLGGASVAAHGVPVKPAHLCCIYNIVTFAVETMWSHE